jgi:type IV secretion system protein VirD4
VSVRLRLAAGLVVFGAVAWLPLTSAALHLALPWTTPPSVAAPVPAYVYWRDYRDTPGIARWLPLSAGAAGIVALLPACVVLFAPRRRIPNLRPQASGEPRAIVRGGSDNHGHADWLPIPKAIRTLRYGERAPSLVIGEAVRMDETDVAEVDFDPDDRTTWGPGGRVPLLFSRSDRGPGHAIIFAPTGGFKTSTAITRLLLWTGPKIVLDPSREMGPMLRRTLESMGQQVVEIGSHEGLDVLADIDPTTSFATRRLLSAVASICGEEPGRDENTIFRDAGRNLVACILGHIIWDDALPRSLRTVRFFRELITTPEDAMRLMLAGIARTTRCTVARLTASTLMGLVDETFSGAYFNASQFTAWMYDDEIMAILSAGSIRASDATRGPIAVFIQIPLDVLHTTPAVARVLVDAFAWAFIEADGQYFQRTLMLVDEASKLGRMKSLEIVRDTGRKYGLTLMLNFLSEADLSEVWGRYGMSKWTSQMAWCGYAGVSDRETARGVSEEMGDYAVLAVSEGQNKGSSVNGFASASSSRGENASVHEVKRRLVFGYELAEARADELFVVRKGGRPLRIRQAISFCRPELVPLVDRNRFVRAA